ncbi:MAG: DUF4153 domain-containing protein, partial [Bacillota bacterium]
EGSWLMAAAVLAAAGMVWRASPALQALDVLAVALTLGLAAAYGRKPGWLRGGVVDYVLHFLLTGAQAAAGPIPALALDVRWGEVSLGDRRGRVLAALRGLAVALPQLLLFGALFSAADAVFAQMIGRVFDFNLNQFVGHLMFTLFWAWIVAGWLRASSLGPTLDDLHLQRPAGTRLGAIETGVVLGALNVLFLAFVLVQFRYFFGGAALVQATTGLTYAEYARRGFFELVKVAALVLPLLLLFDWLQPEDRPAQRRLYRWLAGLLVAQLFIIMASAVQRMLLYQQAFGLTELRLYTSAFMAWLGLTFLWFVLTVLRGRRERFAFGALVAGFAVLVSLHVINPDGLIIRTNIARYQAGHVFDVSYGLNLSPDGIPALVEAMALLPEADQASIARTLESKWQPHDSTDWRTWNWGRERARVVLGAKGLVNSPGPSGAPALD